MYKKAAERSLKEGQPVLSTAAGQSLGEKLYAFARIVYEMAGKNLLSGADNLFSGTDNLLSRPNNLAFAFISYGIVSTLHRFAPNNLLSPPENTGSRLNPLFSAAASYRFAPISYKKRTDNLASALNNPPPLAGLLADSAPRR